MYQEQIIQRMEQLIQRSASLQYKTQDALPHPTRSTIGQYPSQLMYILQLGEQQWVFERQPDANASSVMGLWLLSRSRDLLQHSHLARTETCEKLLRQQLERGSHLPGFFQGDTTCQYGCPPGTMGWFPLIDGWRLPLYELPKGFAALNPAEPVKYPPSLSDGDIWAWCQAISHTTPSIFPTPQQFSSPTFYRPLLGHNQLPEQLKPASLSLHQKVSGEAQGFPIGTYYNPPPKRQRFSTPVIANIMASIALLPSWSERDLQSLAQAATFVNRATQMAIQQTISWQEYAYDYCAIPMASIAYVIRGHQLIAAQNNPKYPTLLTTETIQLVVSHVLTQTQRLMQELTKSTTIASRAAIQASLVYCFHALAHLEAMLPNAIPHALINTLNEALVNFEEETENVAGTGPYPMVSIGPITLSIAMSSPCFVLPPFIEALALHLHTHTQAR